MIWRVATYNPLDIDLPKKSSEIGLIRRIFLDPTASHLIITTTSGENFYLHSQTRQPKALSRLKGVGIDCIGWNPSQPTASTREILVGSSDGNVYEVYIEPSSEFYRREEKYLKGVYKNTEGAVTGIWVDAISNQFDARRILISTRSRLLCFDGRIGRTGAEGSGSVYSKLFEVESPFQYESGADSNTGLSMLVTSPDPEEGNVKGASQQDRQYGWLSPQGVLHGNLPPLAGMGNAVLDNSKMLPRTKIPKSESASGRKRVDHAQIESIALTQWHILCLLEGRIVAAQRLDEKIVYDQAVLEPGEKALGLVSDHKNGTFWLFTRKEIFEVVVTDEDRDVWKIMLEAKKYDLAMQYAHSATQKEAVAAAMGDHLIKKRQYMEAAATYGKSSRPFEQVALTLIDLGEQDALRKYLITKLATYKKTSIMQRTMIASWLVEVYMSKLNSLDDTITTNAQLTERTSTADTKDELGLVKDEFQDFITKYRNDLDSKTTYEVISSHGREQELLAYATAVDDYEYVLSYWVQRERWPESLDVLKKQTNPEAFYKYSSVLMAHVATELVDVLMRHSILEPRKLIPALLNYNKDKSIPNNQNQAARYLNFCITSLGSTDVALHNTLISIYAASDSPDETALLKYLISQSHLNKPNYDTDFAIRLCIQHKRIHSVVHIYSSTGQYDSAVSLALKHDEIELASQVADQIADSSDTALRKKLWLSIAQKVVSGRGTGSIKKALEFLERCNNLLRIEDLIPLFPDFVVIDDFKDQICAALESYTKSIATLDDEMDSSAATAESIKAEIASLGRRYAIVEPGERCRVCELPLLSRQFFVFPSCQHGFHSDCLGKKVVEGSGITTKARIRELQAAISRGGRRERESKELDTLVAQSCILCGDFAIKQIEEPFVTQADNHEEWAI